MGEREAIVNRVSLAETRRQDEYIWRNEETTVKVPPEQLLRNNDGCCEDPSRVNGKTHLHEDPTVPASPWGYWVLMWVSIRHS